MYSSGPSGYPARDKLEGRDGDTQKRRGVWVCQVLPRYGLLAERPRLLMECNRGGGGRTHFSALLRKISSVHPQTLDANHRGIEGPPYMCP